MSNSSRHSSQPPEDWDHPESTIDPSNANAAAPTRVAFPSQGGVDDHPRPDALLPHAGSRTGTGKRTLSELLKLHAEKGTDVHFTPQEAARLGEVLGQWINSGSSPYEGEDEFFSRSAPAGDSITLAHRSSTLTSILARPPHGQGESIALGS